MHALDVVQSKGARDRSPLKRAWLLMVDEHELAKLVDNWIKGTLFGRDDRGRATPIHNQN